MKELKDKYLNILPSLELSEFGENDLHSFNYLSDILTITKPKNILEIGFARGSSSLIWLLLSEKYNTQLTSIDLNYRSRSIDTLKLLFPDRFSFFNLNSQHIGNIEQWKNKFDLIFIDGDHSDDGVRKDIIEALKLNPKYIAFHDWLNGGDAPIIQKAVLELGYERLRYLISNGPKPGIALFYILPAEPEHIQIQ